jgi:homospermidine synthase
MNDEFYAVLKLITAEEVLGYAEVYQEGIVIYDPLIIEDMSVFEDLMEDARSQGLKLSKWIKSTTDNFFFIHDSKILTVNELVEPGLSHYKKAVKQINNHEKKFIDKIEKSKERKRYSGYRCTLKEARSNFEDLFKKY